MQTETTPEGLLNCPFCGGDDVFVERADLSSCYVMCNICQSQGPVSCDINPDDANASEADLCDPGEMPARRLWNMRATPASTRPAPVPSEVTEEMVHAMVDASRAMNPNEALLFDQAEELLQAALQAASPASERAQGWQPIKTAPKDGTHIIVAYDWDENSVESGVYFAEQRQCMLGARAGERGPGFMSSNCQLPVYPTHWLPIPPVPGRTKSAEHPTTQPPAPAGEQGLAAQVALLAFSIKVSGLGIREIARRAGVSPTTVMRAKNGDCLTLTPLLKIEAALTKNGGGAEEITALRERVRVLEGAFDAAKAFIDCHAADPDLTAEMVERYAQYQAALEAMDQADG